MIAKIDEVIERAVIANRMDTITKEMGYALERSSRSPIFAEACDFACGICNGDGDLVSQINGIPILAAAGTFSIKEVIRKYSGQVEEGDVFIINDPYQGGNHLPDIGIITPLVVDEEVIFYCVSRAHHGDIGGSVAGSYNAKATEIFQEGLRIPPIKLVSKGQVINEVMDLITRNVRNPDMLQNDLWAQIGANKIGVRRLKELIHTYSSSKVKETVGYLLDHAERLTRQAIKELPDGDYVGEEWVDDDGFQLNPIRIKVTVRIRGEQMTLDFKGTDPQVKGFVNSAFVTSTTAAWIGALWALGSDIPRNSGAFRGIKVVLPEGSLVNPKDPAPVTLSTLTPASEIISAIFQALSSIKGVQLPAGFGRYCGPSFYGIDPRTQEFYVGFAFCALGSGGGTLGRDGYPYMAPLSNYGGVRAPNIEANEIQYPHLTLCHEMESNTAGSGKWRGGAGIRYSILFQGEPTNIVMFGDGMKIPPFGAASGKSGSLNYVEIKTVQGETICLASKESTRSLAHGTILTVVSSGGGGWGDPWQRDPERVWRDVLDEIITVDKAEQDYGVLIGQEGVDWAATNDRRSGNQR
ncbi:hydantoinase B/oxoprolinase family protein [Desulfosporosinus meridiei]|uniref:N-methylhydantoinase B/acetone carboxylase, alpha subunit n=1 Tax=Desulfosporosinus meridiei (strain ATCC BAA-275 / DSM 13257 / KCTC 12902 / NCIMB 13706 / S10) TaxID=768704 RepID=J7ITH6_DESMD|nr:hydantoinase B/oxoprolinase family protein [Desulfosporosinus meridiei]AFQ45010.1 N-methylhydantoinase B/acetone carboxylase, alpha subunit [Desulfosporosinus meridiei DSM 13257]